MAALSVMAIALNRHLALNGIPAPGLAKCEAIIAAVIEDSAGIYRNSLLMRSAADIANSANQASSSGPDEGSAT